MRAATLFATAARPFIATSAAAPGPPALQTTASAHGARLIIGGTMRVTSTSTGTTSFAAPTITPGLATATITATPGMPTTAMAAAGSEHLPPTPGASERAYRGLLPQLLQDYGDHPALKLTKIQNKTASANATGAQASLLRYHSTQESLCFFITIRYFWTKSSRLRCSNMV